MIFTNLRTDDVDRVDELPEREWKNSDLGHLHPGFWPTIRQQREVMSTRSVEPFSNKDRYGNPLRIGREDKNVWGGDL